MSLNHISTLIGHIDRVWCVSWHPLGKLIATCGGDKTIRIWLKQEQQQENKEDEDDEKEKHISYKCIQIINDIHSRTIRTLIWSPDGKYLASGSFDGKVIILKIESKEYNHYNLIPYISLEGHENEIKCIAWHNCNNLIATCSRDRTIWIWEMNKSQTDCDCISVLMEHTQDVKLITWHITLPLLLSCSYDDTIKIWKEGEDDWECIQTLSEHTSTIWSICFEPILNTNNISFVSVSNDLSMIIWNQQKKNDDDDNDNLSIAPLQQQWKAKTILSNIHTGTIFSVDWSKLGIIVTGSADNSIKIFTKDEISNIFQQSLYIENAHDSDINCVKWNPNDNNILATSSDDNVIKIWKYIP